MANKEPMEPRYYFTNSKAIPWRASTVADGVEVKDLGQADGRSMQLVRIEPGTTFPIHYHAGPEFINILGRCCKSVDLLLSLSCQGIPT